MADFTVIGFDNSRIYSQVMINIGRVIKYTPNFELLKVMVITTESLIFAIYKRINHVRHA